MRVLLIKAQSLYGGTRLFADAAADAFRRAGHEAEVLDLMATADARAHLMAHADQFQPDLVFTISILGEFRTSDGRTLAQLYDAPHVLWHVDNPVGQFPRIEATDPSTALLFIDPTHVDAIVNIYGAERFRSLGFMPHAAVGAPALDETVDAYAARPNTLLFSGSFQPLPDPYRNVAPHLHKPLKSAIEAALAVEWVPPHEATRAGLAAHGLHDPGLLKLSGRVDDMVRRTRRLDFAKAVAKTRLPMRLCGVGWEAQFYRFKGGVYEGAVDMTRMTELMRETRIVLNTNVNFGAGSHERPLSAALAGALPFSDHSRFYETAFGDDIALYRWKDLDGAMAKLNALAADPQAAYDIAQRSYQRVLGAHLWDHRIGTIIAAGDAVRQ